MKADLTVNFESYGNRQGPQPTTRCILRCLAFSHSIKMRLINASSEWIPMRWSIGILVMCLPQWLIIYWVPATLKSSRNHRNHSNWPRLALHRDSTGTKVSYGLQIRLDVTGRTGMLTWTLCGSTLAKTQELWPVTPDFGRFSAETKWCCHAIGRFWPFKLLPKLN